MNTINMTDTPPREPQETAQERLTAHKEFAGKPGQQYVSEFLPPLYRREAQIELEWMASAIDDGSLVACPRCHFLRLPIRPFPPETGEKHQDSEPLDCDVCGYISSVLDFHFGYDHMDKRLAEAPAALAEARLRRARLFYKLWMSALDSAEALVWGTMGAALEPLRCKPNDLAVNGEQTPRCLTDTQGDA